MRIGLGPGVPVAAGQAFLERTGVPLLDGFGSTETNFVIATAPDSPRRGVMGWLRPGFEARVAGEHDVELAAGEAGELLLRADEPYAFASGYFNMPEKTLDAVRDHGEITGDQVRPNYDHARQVMKDLADAGIDYDDVIAALEEEGVEKFVKSWDELLGTVKESLEGAQSQ